MSVNVGILASEFPNDNPALHGGVIWVCLEPTASPTPELVPRSETAVVARTIAVVIETVEPMKSATPRDVASEPPEEVPPTFVDVAPESDEGFLVEEMTPLAPTVEAIAVAMIAVEPNAVEEEIVVEELPPLEEPLPLEEPAAVTLAAAVAPATPIVVFESMAPPSITNESSAPPPPSDDPFTMLVCTLADVAISAGSPNVASLLPGLFFDMRLPDALDDEARARLQAAGISNGEGVDATFLATVSAWRAILRGTSDDFSACGSMLDEWASDLLARLLETKAAAPKLRQQLRERGVAAFGLAA